MHSSRLGFLWRAAAPLQLAEGPHAPSGIVPLPDLKLLTAVLGQRHQQPLPDASRLPTLPAGSRGRVAAERWGLGTIPSGMVLVRNLGENPCQHCLSQQTLASLLTSRLVLDPLLSHRFAWIELASGVAA